MTLGAIGSVAGTALKIANSAWSLVRKLWKRDAVDSASVVMRTKLPPKEPLQLELVPITYEVGLRLQVPKLEVLLLAINYLDKPLDLREVTITCHVGSGPTFESLSLVMQAEIPPHRSQQVLCRRPLVESEITLLKASYVGGGPLDGSAQVSALGRAGKKEVRIKPGEWYGVRGWISGLPAVAPAQSASQ